MEEEKLDPGAREHGGTGAREHVDPQGVPDSGAREPYETADFEPKLVLTPEYVETQLLKEPRNQYKTKHPVGFLALVISYPFSIDWWEDTGKEHFPKGGVVLSDGNGGFFVVSHEQFEENFVRVKTKNTKLTKLGE